jgi:glycosyltransferase involved in cell wall biosynthesis
MQARRDLQLTIWMNTPSFYQLDLCREIASLESVSLKIIFAYDLPMERQNLGWRTEIDDDLDVHFLDSRYPVVDAARLAWQQRQRIHIVNGVWAEKPFTAALTVLRVVCPHYLIYSEGPDPFHYRSWFKKALHKLLSMLLVNTHRASLLSVSNFAKSFYLKHGFLRDRIYDFAYFRGENRLHHAQADIDGKSSIIFVGQLIARKRVDLLLAAAAPLVNEHFTISIVGDGEERAKLQNQSDALGISEFVHFWGVVPSDEVLHLISQSDVLILPSDYDGWGLVVNEALMAGIPAIVSDGCGVAETIRMGENGFVFRQGNIASLRGALEAFLSTDYARLRRNAYATGQQLLASVASRYLVDCVRHKLGTNMTKPIPPWQNRLNQASYREEGT